MLSLFFFFCTMGVQPCLYATLPPGYEVDRSPCVCTSWQHDTCCRPQNRSLGLVRLVICLHVMTLVADISSDMQRCLF